MLAPNKQALFGRPSPFCADLSTIYSLWSEESLDGAVMKPSNHLAIRKAVAAVGRVSGALSERMSDYGATSHRILPEITPTTRVRHTPKRFWIEFDFAGASRGSLNHSQIFAEIRQSAVTVGVRLPSDTRQINAPLKQRILFLGLNAKDGNKAETDWHLAQLTPPATQSECSRDVNSWLGQRFGQQVDCENRLAVCCKLNETHPSFETLAKSLADASAQFGLSLATGVLQ